MEKADQTTAYILTSLSALTQAMQELNEKIEGEPKVPIVPKTLAALATPETPATPATPASPKVPKTPKTTKVPKSIYSAYIKRLIDETAEWRNKEAKYVNLSDVKEYRKHAQYKKMTEYFRIGFLQNRLYRLEALTGEKLRSQLDDALCRNIGMCRRDLCMEPQFIARHFNAESVLRHYSMYDAIDANRSHLERAKCTIFALEEEYGIVDTDREDSKAVYKTLSDNGWRVDCSGSCTPDNLGFLRWFEYISGEFQRIFNGSSDEANQALFLMAERNLKKWDRVSSQFKFSNNVTLNLHTIMNDTAFLPQFMTTVNGFFISTW